MRAQNSGRSQFAAVLLSRRATVPTAVSSVGAESVADVEPNLAQVLQEVDSGLDPADPHSASIFDLCRIRDAVEAHVSDLVAFRHSPASQPITQK